MLSSCPPVSTHRTHWTLITPAYTLVCTQHALLYELIVHSLDTHDSCIHSCMHSSYPPVYTHHSCIDSCTHSSDTPVDTHRELLLTLLLIMHPCINASHTDRSLITPAYTLLCTRHTLLYELIINHCALTIPAYTPVYTRHALLYSRRIAHSCRCAALLLLV